MHSVVVKKFLRKEILLEEKLEKNTYLIDFISPGQKQKENTNFATVLKKNNWNFSTQCVTPLPFTVVALYRTELPYPAMGIGQSSTIFQSFFLLITYFLLGIHINTPIMSVQIHH